MHKLTLDIFDNNPFNDLKYVKERLAKDGVKISPYRDIVDEEDYLEMLPGMLAQQEEFERIIKERNLKISIEEFSTSVHYCRF
jgi:hypothetical protein